MPFAAQTQDLVGTTIGQSFITAQKPLWMWAPKCESLDERSGVGQVTYKLPSLHNFLLGQFNPDWAIGTEPPIQRQITFDSVSTESIHGHTRVWKRPAHRPEGHRYKDLENLSPGIFSIMSQGLDKETVGQLVNTTDNSSSSFTGTNPLDKYGGDLTPLTDINEDIATIRKLRNLLGMSLEAVMDQDSALVFRGQAQYSGWGEQFAGGGTGQSRLMDEGEFLTRFKAAHKLDHVEIFDGIYNSAVIGATVSIDYFDQFLWIGLCDRRKATHMLKNQESLDTPDGAFMLNLSRKPEMVSWNDGMRTESEYFAGRWARDFFSPRYSADGTQVSIVYLSAEIHT